MMVSPFPGMDPYLEDPAIWSDFHTTLIVHLRAAINERLPPGYVASTERHVVIENVERQRRRLREPDVFVVRSKKQAEATSSSTMMAAPRTITLPLRERKGRPFIKILDRRERRVVTIVELLSPTNKSPGEHHQQYLAKRDEYFASGINLVEINLLRAGKVPPLGEIETERLQYYILVCRAGELPKAEIWPFTVRDRFPDFPIPLRPGSQITLNLRPSVERAYREAHYDDEIDYARPPSPPFAGRDATWVRQVAKKTLK
jgi:hypothetical protein